MDKTNSRRNGIQSTSTLFEDNQGCISTSREPVVNDRVKHIDIKYHWIRHEVEKGTIQLEHCATSEMTADIQKH